MTEIICPMCGNLVNITGETNNVKTCDIVTQVGNEYCNECCDYLIQEYKKHKLKYFFQ